jgi:hypothetical protein
VKVTHKALVGTDPRVSSSESGPVGKKFVDLNLLQSVELWKESAKLLRNRRSKLADRKLYRLGKFGASSGALSNPQPWKENYGKGLI